MTNNFSAQSAQFENLLAARAGIHIRAQDRAFVAQTLDERARSRQITAEQYLNFLEGAASSSEWTQLFVLLTNQESYFFRDSGQFALLREHILPEIIARNCERRALKLWSAGCSTGEEAYSLAMTLDALMPSQQGWNIEIQATDLSQTALQKARAATYSAWSFRNTSNDLRDRYFHKRGDEWVFEARLRERVTFRQSNLLDEVSFQGLGECDLILCRNVFIYFRREAVAQVVRKFRDALRIGGYLVTGHAELHDIKLPDLETRTFAQSVVHQRVSSTRLSAPSNRDKERAMPLKSAFNGDVVSPFAFVKSSSCTLPKATLTKHQNTLHINRASRNSTSMVEEPDAPGDKLKTVRRARDLLRAGRSEDALALLQKVLRDTSACSSMRDNHAAYFGAHCLMAQHHANNARHDEAVVCCARAIALDALAPLPYHVQARIEEERGQSERARELLKKVIYLAPRSVVAMIELSAIYGREGDAERAKSWRNAALQLLIEYSNDETLALPEWSLDQMQSAGKLTTHLQSEK